ncbi:hypothetical protein PLICRDRAFT_180141 [Plicaturopsis crispa FD-325 SS-3]|uniref:Uncharacterized protein n=1 Tax=Plicaturopsis crispa FD-325 SS-3 TaxID=944288 RepID=A0A0C9T3E7_PLICR|nr:hypothetical protein PLICRDRAFT_180141 [Plicaturopsis crispa FD-325 SS-3]
MSVRARALQTETSSRVSSERPTSTGVVAVVSSTSDSPYFPTATSVSDGASRREAVSKNILIVLFSIVAIVLLAFIVTWRLCYLRRNNRSLRLFFVRSYSSELPVTSTPTRRLFPRTTGLPLVQPPSRPASVVLPPSFLYPSLLSLPVPRQHRRSTRAADTDAGGRRAGTRDPDDPYADDKDMLPAYDNVGGPPTYIELDMPARLQRRAAGAPTPSTVEGPSMHSSLQAGDGITDVVPSYSMRDEHGLDDSLSFTSEHVRHSASDPPSTR